MITWYLREYHLEVIPRAQPSLANTQSMINHQMPHSNSSSNSSNLRKAALRMAINNQRRSRRRSPWRALICLSVKSWGKIMKKSTTLMSLGSSIRLVRVIRSLSCLLVTWLRRRKCFVWIFFGWKRINEREELLWLLRSLSRWSKRLLWLVR